MFRFGEKMEKTKANCLNPVVLAFVGDAVYSLFVRERLTFMSDGKAGELNKLAVKEVKASAQAEFITELLPLLTEEETAVFKRARNAKKPRAQKTRAWRNIIFPRGSKRFWGIFISRETKKDSILYSIKELFNENRRQKRGLRTA